VSKKSSPEMQAPPLTPDCALCRSANRASYAVMKRLNASDEEISELAQASITQVQEHFRTCAPIFADSIEGTDAISASDAELQRLLVDATELAYAATIAGQYSAAAAATSCRGRAGNEMARRAELRQIHADALDSCQPDQPELWNEKVSDFVARYLDFLLRERESV